MCHLRFGLACIRTSDSKCFALLLLLFFSTLVGGVAADALERGFAHPPESTKPWCYWYWISDNISREGITRDLEAMQRVGIGEAFIGNIYLNDVKTGEVKALSEPWWGMVEHAIREGQRLGVNVGLFNCPGWSQSGGPWIRPDQAMRYVAMSEQRVHGPRQFAEKLATPREPFQPVALLAFPAPANDADTLAAHRPRITCRPSLDQAERLVDGNRKTVAMFPGGAGQGKQPFQVDIELAEAMTARSLVLVPAESDFSGQCELQVADPQGGFVTVRRFAVDRSNNSVGVGFLPHSPVAIAFAAQTSRHFRLVFTGCQGNPGLAEIELSGAARLERFVEKQLGKMHPTPLPMWDAYLWPAAAEPESAALAVAPGTVLDLSQQLGADGVLRWEVPAGDWILLRTGMTPTGTKNSPASPEGQGLEVDKMNRAAAQAHFDAYVGKLLKRMPKAERQAFKHVVADSYEMGSQNWTDGFRELFRKRYAYDPQPWLPVLTGRVVGSAEQSDRFLWDLRRLVADRIAFDYVGGLREAANREGLKLWLENYGHWGYPAEFLQYGGQADEVSGEFWATGDLGSIELRCAASAAHIYGKPIVHAEAFTSGLRFESTPWSLKRRGDWALTEGINHWVLHVYIHQPWEDRLPGVNAWFSTEFNRHNTWFYPGREWIDYYRRCDFLLQQGRHVADVAYFIGEDTPKMTGLRQPALPPGYNFDYLNAEVIEQRLEVKNGRWVLPDGMSYRLVVLPELATMRPKLLQKLRDLVAAGGCALGAPPTHSPSLQNYPECDQAVKQLAAELWAGCDGQTHTRARFGKGQVFRNMELQPVLDALGIRPDFAGADPKQILWTHRSSGEAEIYFLSNQSEQPASITPVFRVSDKAPEFWDAANQQIVSAAAFEVVPGGVRVPVELEARGSLFVLFRRAVGKTAAVVQVSKDKEVVLSTAARPILSQTILGPRHTTNTFTMAGWVKPAVEIALPKEADAGVFIHLPRNDAVFPVHGTSVFSQSGHACAGISAGRNGVCVYEHSGDYFAPVLVHPIALTNWTHLAVVYQNGRPSLFVNGQRVHQGLASRFQVHSAVGGDQNASFKGERSEFRDFAHALTETEVLKLAGQKPPGTGGSPMTAITLTRSAKGGLEAEVFERGRYMVKMADGRGRSVEVLDLPEPLALTGPWEVQFPPHREVPEQIRLEELVSLTEHRNEAVKYFSGTATYRHRFDLAANRLGKDKRVLLDLGQVEALAEVSLNGQELGVVWKPPFIVDLTRATRAGANRLEVRVTGTWRNRLIGEAKYPNGFPDANKGATHGGPFKSYLTADIKLRPDEALTASGLIGPVRIQSGQRLEVPVEKRD